MSWVSVKRGGSLPLGAIVAGATQADGVLYIGRSGSEVGKYNVEGGTDAKSEKMWNLWLLHSGPHMSGEILCCPIDAEVNWVRRNKGDALPEGAFLAGHTDADGVLYVGRVAHDDEVGKLNVHSGVPGGKCHNLWCQTRRVRGAGAETSYDVLCFRPKEISITLHLLPIVMNLGGGKGQHKETKTIKVGTSHQYDSKMLAEINSKAEASIIAASTMFHADAELNAMIKSAFTGTLQNTHEETTVVKEFSLDLAVPQYVYVGQITLIEGWTIGGDVMVYSPTELLETTFTIPLKTT